MARRAVVIATTFALTASAAIAQSRPSTTQMSCGQAQATVAHSGAAVLGTGGGTYDRIVRDASFCFYGQRLRPVVAPTRDNPRCFVGNRCFDESLDPR
jgi:hypothetical protein